MDEGLRFHCVLPMVMCEFGQCCLFVTQTKEVRSRSGYGKVQRNCKNENELHKFVLVFVLPYGTA